jgi:MFS family permease
VDLQGAKQDFRIFSFKTLAVSIATVSTLAWFFLLDTQLISILKGTTNSVFWAMFGEVVFFGFAIVSAIVGSFLSDKVNRRKILWVWITLGVVSTISLMLIQGVLLSLIVCGFLGVSLGLGFPVITAFLADNTTIEKRARVSALIMLETFIVVILGFVGATIFSLSLFGIVTLCALIRAVSYFSLFLDPCYRTSVKSCSYREIVTNRIFLLYIVPWLMFNLATGLATLVINSFQSPEFVAAYNLSVPIRLVGAAAFGVFGGIMADRFGRKQPIIIALVILGSSFTFLGLAPSYLSFFAFRIISGAAWGVLMVVYLAVPGDISSSGSKEKYYALGWSLPLMIYLGLADIPVAFNIQVDSNFLSPLLTITLFGAVIPILYAVETLPRRKIRERKLKEHIDNIGKLLEESKKKSGS